MTELAAAPSCQEQPIGLSWAAARLAAHRAGTAAMLAEVTLRLRECDGGTLAAELRAACDLPPFPASAVDGYAVRGPSPWRLTGRVLAGEIAPPLASHICGRPAGMSDAILASKAGWKREGTPR